MEKEAHRQRPKLLKYRKSICHNDIFGLKMTNQQCKKKRRRKVKNSILESLSVRLQQAIKNVEGEEILTQLHTVQNVLSVLKKVKKAKKIKVRSPLGRKLLSLDQCDSENCPDPEKDEADGDLKETNEAEIDDEDSEDEEINEHDEESEDEEIDEDDEEREDGENEDEESEDEEIGDEDLLDAESLAKLLANKDLSEKIAAMNDVLDDLESKLKLNLQEIDEDLYVSAIQSLIVYIYSVEEMQEVPRSKQSSEDVTLLQQLSDRMKAMKKTYLSQVTNFELFFSKSWELFIEIIEDKIFLDRSNRESVDKINEFAFNFHYAAEIEKIIRRRAIEDETDIIEEFEEDLGMMRQVYEHLGFAEEIQDEGYFSRMLSGMVSEEEDDEETHKNRKLLSIPDEVPSEGYCSKDDPDCDSPSESLLKKKEMSVPDVDRPLTDLEKCDGLLRRARQIGQSTLQEDKLRVLTGGEKVKYIKSFITELKESRGIVHDYNQHLKNIKDPQDYHRCYKMLEEDLGKLQKQMGNTNWLKHLSSLIASNDKEVLAELTDLLQDRNIDKDSTSFKKRNLLSVKNDDFCEKDDVGCRERKSFTNDQDLELQNSDKEQAVENLKQELEDSYEEMKVRDLHKKGKKSDVFRCQELLTKSEQELTKFHKIESKNKNIKNMRPKQKIKLIRQYMTQMTSTKALIDEHQRIVKTIDNSDDKKICQPLLQV